MMAYMGLPLDIFGKDAFFQPYLPLQQLDLLKDSEGWLCGSTNSIVTQQKEVELLINTETALLEFRNPALERLMGLTAADRKWMDEIVRDVNDAWDDADPTKPAMHFKGSDDYLRAKFEEYVSAALASVRYREFLAKGKVNNVIITGTGGDDNSIDDFNPLWIAEFTKTNAYDVWQRSTDPMLFDIVEPRHPCNEKPSVVGDIGIRLSEGLQELKLEQQLAPTREAISRTITASSTNFFKAVEGVRGRWQQRTSSSASFNSDLTSSTYESPVEVSKSELGLSSPPASEGSKLTPNITRQTSRESASGTPMRPVSVAQAASDAKVALGNWGAGIQSFWSGRASRFSMSRSSIASVASTDSLSNSSTVQLPTSPISPSQSRPSVGTVEEESEHDLDHKGYESQEPGGIAL